MKPNAFDGNSGCIALLLSVALAALILTLAIFATSNDSLGIFVAVFVVTGFVVAVVGLPLYLLVLHLRRESVWTASAVGAATGAALPLLSAIWGGTREAWMTSAAYAAVGAVSGLAFFLTATAASNPARNLSILVALAGISVALAPLASTWLS